ncbi:thioredoxin [Thalassoporum mexicanum PCC 7367]|uniref:thioredoxin n=1 Tax=Thalassoporum mexicanum TaxID=3457544 RepID=UPI00029FEA69|nr:thioredoxin [Pseudanabaena sp. PCC 7367]AFY69464.1 thioredoxin [Pseudanabaena sp. PCC 7367]
MAVKKQFDSFEDLLKSSELPILVDFYAPWCGPCQIMARVLEQVSPQVKDKAQIVKINTDIYQGLASQYGIHGLPTMMIFKDGKPVDRFEGAVTADQLYERLQPHI